MVQRRLAMCEDLPRKAAWRNNHGWPPSVEVEDLEQIAFLALWEAAHRTAPEKQSHFRAIANSAMNNRITDVRRRLIGREGQRMAINSAGHLHPETYDAPAEEGLGFEHIDEFRQAIQSAKFTEQQHRVLELVLEDLSNIEIADRIGITAIRVSQIRAEIKKRLRPHMSPA